MLAPIENARCNGVTKAGKRCSITAQSTIRDAAGRLVGQPLAQGSPCCLFHASFFQVLPAELRDEVVTYAYIDLETDSLDFLSGNIVEIGALVSGSRAAFSTVINPGNRGSQEPGAVHGISPEEILQGPSFREAFQRLDQFLRYASVSVPASDIDSEDDSAPVPATAMMPDLEIALVGHNSFRFDFPFLLAECLRCGLGASAMSHWLFVDTMDLLRTTDCAGECKKLQCAFHACTGPSCLRPHRALDDCLALEAVVEHVSARFGVSSLMLLRHFARRLDGAATVAQLSALIAD